MALASLAGLNQRVGIGIGGVADYQGHADVKGGIGSCRKRQQSEGHDSTQNVSSESEGLQRLAHQATILQKSFPQAGIGG